MSTTTGRMPSRNPAQSNKPRDRKMSLTGRIIRDEPNFQNIPVRTEDGRKVRDALIKHLKDL